MSAEVMSRLTPQVVTSRPSRSSSGGPPSPSELRWNHNTAPYIAEDFAARLSTVISHPNSLTFTNDALEEELPGLGRFVQLHTGSNPNISRKDIQDYSADGTSANEMHGIMMMIDNKLERHGMYEMISTWREVASYIAAELVLANELRSQPEKETKAQKIRVATRSLHALAWKYILVSHQWPYASPIDSTPTRFTNEAESLQKYGHRRPIMGGPITSHRRNPTGAFGPPSN